MSPHLDDDLLLLYEGDPDAVDDRVAVEMHLGSCDDCAERHRVIRLISSALSDAETWTVADERREPPAMLRHLRSAVERLSGETHEAERILGPLVASPFTFIWADVSRRRDCQTSGAVRFLVDAATARLETEPIHALNLTDAAVAIAEGLPTSRYTAREIHQLRGLAWKGRANALRYRGEFKNALQALDRAAKEWSRTPATGLEWGSIAYIRAAVLSAMGEFSEASAQADHAARYFADVGDTKRHFHARLVEATVLYRSGNVEGARDRWLAVLAYAESENDAELIARVSANIGNCYLDLRDTAKASQYFMTALPLYQELGLLTEIARLRWSLALLILVAGKAEQAIPRLEAARAECERLEMNDDVLLISLDICEALMVAGRPAAVVARCAEVISRTENPLSALRAFAFLKEVTAAGKATVETVRYVRRFVARLADNRELAFAPPDPPT